MKIAILKAEKPTMSGKVENIYSIAILTADGISIKISGIKALTGSKGGQFYALPSERKYNFETRQTAVDAEGKQIYVPRVEIEQKTFQEGMRLAVEEYTNVSAHAAKSSSSATPIYTPKPMPPIDYGDCPF